MRPLRSGLIISISALAGIIALLVSARSCRSTALPSPIAISFTNVNALISNQLPTVAPLWVCVATNSSRRHIAFWAESIEYKAAGEWMSNRVPAAVGGGFLFSGAVGPTSKFEGVFSLAPTNTAILWRARFRYQASGPLGDLVSHIAGSTIGTLILGARSQIVISEEVVPH